MFATGMLPGHDLINRLEHEKSCESRKDHIFVSSKKAAFKHDEAQILAQLRRCLWLQTFLAGALVLESLGIRRALDSSAIAAAIAEGLYTHSLDSPDDARGCSIITRARRSTHSGHTLRSE